MNIVRMSAGDAVTEAAYRRIALCMIKAGISW